MSNMARTGVAPVQLSFQWSSSEVVIKEIQIEYRIEYH